MGLGKTVTLIFLGVHRTARPEGSGPVLVVCPASLLGNWQAEIEKFAPGVPVRRLHGFVRGLAVRQRARPPTTMRVDAELLAGVGWDLVVADEAQHVKNARSATARMLRTIPSTARAWAWTAPPRRTTSPTLSGRSSTGRPPGCWARGRPSAGSGRPRIEAGVDPAVTARFRVLGPALPAASPQVRPRDRARACRRAPTPTTCSRSPASRLSSTSPSSAMPWSASSARTTSAAGVGAGDAHRPQADLQPPLPLPQAGQPAALLGEDRPAR